MPITMQRHAVPPRPVGEAAERRLLEQRLLDGPVPFVVVALPGKGMGCIASRCIAQGEKVLAELPLLQQGPGNPRLKDALEALSPCERGAFFSLSQNEVRWGKEKHPAGLYATNGIPAHTWSRNFTAVFATACRLNHACDANAVYKWNPSRGRLTVHATKPIGEGEEITVCYGFPTGTVLRAQRQRHLKDTFGFVCHCTKCALAGDALEDSERRLRAIGDKASVLAELRDWGALDTILSTDAGELLGRLEARYRLMQEEAVCGNDMSGSDDNHYKYLYGLEMYLHAFVEFCDAVTSRLRELTRRGRGSADVAIKARTYAQASRAWAIRALEVFRDVYGDDAPGFLAWSEALISGCWNEEGGSFDFYQRWVDAGMSAPLPPTSVHAAALLEVHALGALPPTFTSANDAAEEHQVTHTGEAVPTKMPAPQSGSLALPLCTSFLDLKV